MCAIDCSSIVNAPTLAASLDNDFNMVLDKILSVIVTYLMVQGTVVAQNDIPAAALSAQAVVFLLLEIIFLVCFQTKNNYLTTCDKYIFEQRSFNLSPNSYFNQHLQ